MLQNKIKNELVSIILPVYNGERFLGQSIQSCLEQTHINIELIIVNDCSTDSSLQIAEEFKLKDGRVSIISNSTNKKLPASLNIGHYLAKGNYITWTSDDNYYEKNAIELLLKNISNSEIDVIYSNFNIIEENGSKRKKVELENASPLLFGNSIGASFLYKKEVFIRNNGYNEELHSVEDYDFWLRGTFHSKFAHTKECLYNFRSHKSSLSTKLGVINTLESRVFAENLKRTYMDFLFQIGNHEKEVCSKLLMKIHQYKEIDVFYILKNYRSFKQVLKIIGEKTVNQDFKELLKSLDIRIRANIQEYQRNQNMKVLGAILKNRPGLLWNYDRRNSIKLVKKCLTK